MRSRCLPTPSLIVLVFRVLADVGERLRLVEPPPLARRGHLPECSAIRENRESSNQRRPRPPAGMRGIRPFRGKTQIFDNIERATREGLHMAKDLVSRERDMVVQMACTTLTRTIEHIHPLAPTSGHRCRRGRRHVRRFDQRPLGQLRTRRSRQPPNRAKRLSACRDPAALRKKSGATYAIPITTPL